MPRRVENISFRLEGLLSKALEHAGPVGSYLHLAGSEQGYSYFAPHVPESYQLVFELHHQNGVVDYETTQPTSAEVDLRLARLLDEIGQADSAPYREVLVKLLAYSAWRRHGDVTDIRAIVTNLELPTVTEFIAGQRPYYELRHVYNFSRPRRER